MLFAPVANAETRQNDHRPSQQQAEKKPVNDSPAHHQWKKGERVSDWKKRAAVKDYSRHGLRKPSKGQQRVKVDNDYLLVSLANSLIISIVPSK